MYAKELFVCFLSQLISLKLSTQNSPSVFPIMFPLYKPKKYQRKYPENMAISEIFWPVVEAVF